MAFTLARRLRAGETVYSGWSSLPAPIVVEVLARSGFSAVAIDMQHGMWDFAAAVTGIGTIAGVGRGADRAHALSRLADGEPRARHGRRGRGRAADQHRRRRQDISSPSPSFRPSASAAGGPARAIMLGGFPDMKSYLRDANDMTVTIAMIETREALANVDAIAAVKGIDVLFVGPSDLSITMSDGAVLDPHSKEVEAAARQGRRRGEESRQGGRALLRDRRARGGDGQARLRLSRGRQRPRLFARGHRRACEGAKGLTRRGRRGLVPRRARPHLPVTSMTR